MLRAARPTDSKVLQGAARRMSGERQSSGCSWGREPGVWGGSKKKEMALCRVSEATSGHCWLLSRRRGSDAYLFLLFLNDIL